MSSERLTDLQLRIRRWINHSLDSIIPASCILCGDKASNLAVCNDCIDSIPTQEHTCPRCAYPLSVSASCGQCLLHPPEQNSSFSLFLYQNPVDRLIAEMKYHDKIHLCHFFAELMSQQLILRTQPQALIPVPLHAKRLRERGYNQSVELSQALSTRLNIPTLTDHISRIKNTSPQARLPYKKRKQNLKGAFSIEQSDLPEHVAIIDDVLTSGHTANEVARTLRKAGVMIIEVWTIARAIQHR